jgi:hypothetical protein
MYVMDNRRPHLVGGMILSMVMLTAPAVAQSDLGKAAANPIASMISVPLEYTTDFGAENGTAHIVTLQPVIPVKVGDWNFISRPIIPFARVGGFTSGLPGIPTSPEGLDQDTVISGASGLGDINYSLFLSPAKSGKLIWGVGPSITFPTATDPLLGTEKWSAGPTAVALTNFGNITVGGLVRQIWSFSGASDRSDVSQFMLQPFLNLQIGDGWYLSSSPVITANWNAESGNKWTVPVGGGAGRVFKIADQPVNVRLEAYANTEKPSGAPDWSSKFTFQFLFPTN